MHTKPIPEIDASDLKAARDFLTSLRDEERKEHPSRIPLEIAGRIPVRNGIARARLRSVAKTSA